MGEIILFYCLVGWGLFCFFFNKTWYFCFCNQEYQQVSFHFVCCRNFTDFFLSFSFFFLCLFALFAQNILSIFYEIFKCFKKVLKVFCLLRESVFLFLCVFSFLSPLLYVANEKNWLKPHLGHFLFLLGFVRLACQSKGQPVIYGNWGREGRGKKACYVQIL